MKKPRLLDLFCGAGGCSAGYARAGFDVFGVDHEPQPHYPFAFEQADALEYVAKHGHLYDVIAASPPCQHYCSVNQPGRKAGKTYPDLIAATRDLLVATGRIYVIENVIGAPLRTWIRLCGSSFGLPIRRHRLFESNAFLFGLDCNHAWQERTGDYPTCWCPKSGPPPRSSVVQVYGNTPGKKLWPEAMGIDWMSSKELSQAIPPCYTEFLGKQLIRILE